ncbi:protein phosphatase 2C domain-containing protein [Novosphingobium sp.]|uniref:PP2C family protein-serine/threonine phosphatase n=1 Tax=Novosphingobium sp. TaxID=1874826 RepID=UPI003341E7C6
MRYEWHAATDVGAVRRINEDSFFTSEELGVWAVADGMGGMARGDWASAQVVACLNALRWQPDLEATIESVVAALVQANTAILTESEAHGARMGTTAVVLVVRDGRFGVAWVGDSRAYLYRHRQLHRLSRDHSQVQEMVDNGIITAAEAETHRMRNVLTRAVGVLPDLAVDTIVDDLAGDDLLLLCSDGLHGVLGEGEMAEVLARAPLAEAAQILIARCHGRGAPDNITLVTVTAEEVTLVLPGNGAGSGGAGPGGSGSREADTQDTDTQESGLAPDAGIQP